MKNIFLVFSVLVISLLAFSKFNIAFAEGAQEFTKICVPTYDVALEIAKIVCKAVYPDIEFDFDNESYSYNKEDEWEISFKQFKQIDINSSNNEMYYGGGDIIIRIKKTNAEVTYIFLQR